ncbi:MAG: Panacea domain-containing protein [Promethearchaeota archaeon]
MFEAYSVIEALYYILKKIGRADKIKLTKLIYLADKYHLMKYGRTITGDKYYAMPQGPVGSLVLDVLNSENYSLNEEEIAYFKDLINRVGEFNYEIANKNKNKFEYLSETDIEALDYICRKFGKWDSWYLKEYTHKYPEWNQHEKLLKSEIERRVPIKTEELFSKIDDKILEDDEHIKMAKAIHLGEFD